MGGAFICDKLLFSLSTVWLYVLVWNSFEFILFETFWASWMCFFFFFWIWEILALISSNTLSFCLSPIICRSVFLMVSQVSESLICFWFFFLFHSVSQTDWCQLTCFQVHWFLIYYWAAVSTFSFIFFISSYITQTYNFYLIFFRKYFFYIKIVRLVETLFSYSSLVVLRWLLLSFVNSFF